MEDNQPTPEMPTETPNVVVEAPIEPVVAEVSAVAEVPSEVPTEAPTVLPEEVVIMEARPSRRMVAPITRTNTLVPIVSEHEEWDFKKVEQRMHAEYNSDASNKSVICDILAIYLKGQKTLYTEAKTLCEQRLNYLMLPAIFITSVCTILSLVLKDKEYGGTVVSSLNGFNAFLLALISYLKLDAKAEAHRTSAYKFDKLQSQLEFSSGKSMFMEMTQEDMMSLINDSEANVRDIKETNKFILPEGIRNKYPQLHNTNVFAEVKRIQNTEMQMTNSLMNVLNEQQWFRRKAKDRELTEEEIMKRRALKEKELLVIHEIISLKDDYLLIDERFEKEMAAQRKAQRFQLCGCLKT